MHPSRSRKGPERSKGTEEEESSRTSKNPVSVGDTTIGTFLAPKTVASPPMPAATRGRPGKVSTARPCGASRTEIFRRVADPTSPIAAPLSMRPMGSSGPTTTPTQRCRHSAVWSSVCGPGSSVGAGSGTAVVSVVGRRAVPSSSGPDSRSGELDRSARSGGGPGAGAPLYAAVGGRATAPVRAQAGFARPSRACVRALRRRSRLPWLPARSRSAAASGRTRLPGWGRCN